MRLVQRVAPRVETLRVERGQSVVEYSLVLLLVVLVAIGGMVLFASSTQSLWGRIMSNVATAI